MSNFSYSQKLSTLMLSEHISLVGISLLDPELLDVPAWITQKPVRGKVASSKLIIHYCWCHPNALPNRPPYAKFDPSPSGATSGRGITWHTAQARDPGVLPDVYSFLTGHISLFNISAICPQPSNLKTFTLVQAFLSSHPSHWPASPLILSLQCCLCKSCCLQLMASPAEE